MHGMGPNLDVPVILDEITVNRNARVYSARRLQVFVAGTDTEHVILLSPKLKLLQQNHQKATTHASDQEGARQPGTAALTRASTDPPHKQSLAANQNLNVTHRMSSSLRRNRNHLAIY